MHNYPTTELKFPLVQDEAAEIISLKLLNFVSNFTSATWESYSIESKKNQKKESSWLGTTQTCKVKRRSSYCNSLVKKSAPMVAELLVNISQRRWR